MLNREKDTTTAPGPNKDNTPVGLQVNLQRYSKPLFNKDFIHCYDLLDIHNTN